jgi:hypothetical protein
MFGEVVVWDRISLTTFQQAKFIWNVKHSEVLTISSVVSAILCMYVRAFERRPRPRYTFGPFCVLRNPMPNLFSFSYQPLGGHSVPTDKRKEAYGTLHNGALTSRHDTHALCFVRLENMFSPHP